jgi:anti-sigma factor RsiW
MAHDNYRMMISLELDGMLTEREREDLRVHMDRCAACADAWEGMRRMDALLKIQPEAVPTPNFSAHVMARVQTYETQRRWRPWLMTILGGITLAAVVSAALPIVVVAFGLYKPLLSWPIIGEALSWIGRVLMLAAGVVRLGLRDLIRWLAYLTSDPLAMSVAISGLMVASTWIGLLEVMKGRPVGEAAHQQA